MLVTQQGKPYSVFTPFMRNAMTHEVPTPKRNARANYYHNILITPCSSLREADPREATKHHKGHSHFSNSLQLQEKLVQSRILSRPSYALDCRVAPLRSAPRRDGGGGRKAGLAILEKTGFINTYKHARDLPALPGTSHLSPHHKFGTISIRETYEIARTHHGEGAQQFIAELYWRDFYYHIAYHFPHVFGKSFLPWGDCITWRNDPTALTAWQRGETGIPIVDAGMRELNETGWMHNRVRMVVASFLTKNLLIDWREGEKYFAQKLVDYDPAVNNGGWQWSASVGADPRPLRIFNPYTQAQKYDPRAEYITQWVPELQKVPAHLLTDGKEHDLSTLAPTYPGPIVSCRESYHRAREAYAKARRDYARA
ncbi:MAG: deoxyribodipyrimidine photo-lyase [Candidatus Pacebacteria bacterium]|nr:deoxyribodipyrimidine photo-lyase [Candidatus Paceibacterota bacterium]